MELEELPAFIIQLKLRRRRKLMLMLASVAQIQQAGEDPGVPVKGLGHKCFLKIGKVPF